MSAARGDLYLLIVDVTVCKVTPVILHGVVSPEVFGRLRGASFSLLSSFFGSSCRGHSHNWRGTTFSLGAPVGMSLLSSTSNSLIMCTTGALSIVGSSCQLPSLREQLLQLLSGSVKAAQSPSIAWTGEGYRGTLLIGNTPPHRPLQ